MNRPFVTAQLLAANEAALSASLKMGDAAYPLPDPVLKVGVDNLPVNGADRFSHRRGLLHLGFDTRARITRQRQLHEQQAGQHEKHCGEPVSAQAPVPKDFTDGEVRSLDKAARKITLKHAEIKNLGMPPMAMVFDVRDAKLLDKVKTGDKVRFKAVHDAGKYVVVDLQPGM